MIEIHDRRKSSYTRPEKVNNPKVSIITPTFNQAAFLEQCIQSVLEQTFGGWEQIIVDDGSTDNTPEIATKFNDGRIHYIQRNHKGPAYLDSLYNLALEKSQAPFVAILEGDDYWPPWKLESQLRIHNKHSDCVLSWGRTVVVNYRGVKIKELRSPVQSSEDAGFLKALLLNRLHTLSVCVVIRRDALEKIGSFKQPVGYPAAVDYPTYLELLRVGRFIYTDEITGYLRKHATNLSSIMAYELAVCSIKLARDFYQTLPKEVRHLLPASELERGLADWYAGALLSKGRRTLREGNRREAIRTFVQALKRAASPLNKSLALFALTGGMLGCDLIRFIQVIRGRNS